MDTTEPTPLRGKRPEPPEAITAFADYRGLGPARSLERLAEMYQGRTEHVPTRQISTLKNWSRKYDWQARIAAEEAQFAATRRKVQDEERLKKEKDRLKRLDAVGSACLALAEAILNEFVVYEANGTPRLNRDAAQKVSARDLGTMVKVGMECTQLAAGEPTQIVQSVTREDWEQALAEADEASRLRMVEGLAAFAEVQRRLKAV